MLNKILRAIKNPKKYAWVFPYAKKRISLNFGLSWDKALGKGFREVIIEGLKIKMAYTHPYHYLFVKRLGKDLHEAGLFKNWVNYAKEAGGDILDLGGYSGIFGILAASANPSLKVYIFEPEPINAEHIKINISLNNLKNVFLVEAAVNESTGPIFFNRHLGGEGGNISEDGELSILGWSLDDWTQKNGVKPALIKMDVEGAEYRALLGAKKIMAESEKLVLLLELHFELIKKFGNSKENVLSLLDQSGFDLKFVDKGKYNEHYWVIKSLDVGRKSID